jgi:iron complex transport system permease protein
VTTESPDAASLYGVARARGLLVIGLLVLLLLLAGLVGLASGSARVSIPQVFGALGHGILPGLVTGPQVPLAQTVVVDVRLPRVLLAALTGFALACAGAVMQGLLRNPLVSPFTLGLSSAASFGAAVAIVLLPATLAVPFLGGNTVIALAAFLAGWLSMLLVIGIARHATTGEATLILVGVIIAYLFQAGVLLLKYLTDNDRLRDIVIWLMGGMWGANLGAVAIILPVTAVCFLFLLARAWDLNTLSAGDDVARAMGIDVDRFRTTGLLLSTLMASCCLAFTGVIGFIGLMAPHICRILVGGDHRYLIPAASLLGAVILLVSDTLARTVMSPVEIPVGVLMYIIGGVFFIFLILQGGSRHLSS